MTDARIAGPWLFQLNWIRLSDRAVRTLVASFMWSNEAGTDGNLPPECYPLLHPQGVDHATAEELIAAGWWAVSDEGKDRGYVIPDWTGESNQETAATVRNRRANDRRRKAEHRRQQAAAAGADKPDEPPAERDVTPDVTPDVTRHPVGQDTTGQDAVTGSELSVTSAPTHAKLTPLDSPCTECQRRRGMGGDRDCPRLAAGGYCPFPALDRKAG